MEDFKIEGKYFFKELVKAYRIQRALNVSSIFWKAMGTVISQDFDEEICLEVCSENKPTK